MISCYFSSGFIERFCFGIGLLREFCWFCWGGVFVGLEVWNLEIIFSCFFVFFFKVFLKWWVLFCRDWFWKVSVFIWFCK